MVPILTAKVKAGRQTNLSTALIRLTDNQTTTTASFTPLETLVSRSIVFNSTQSDICDLLATINQQFISSVS